MQDPKKLRRKLKKYVHCRWEYTGAPLFLFRCAHGMELSLMFVEHCETSLPIVSIRHHQEHTG